MTKDDELNMALDQFLVDLGAGPVSTVPLFSRFRRAIKNGAVPDKIRVTSTLKALRGSRLFEPMVAFADDFGDHLSERAQLYLAQAKIELGNMGGAESILQALLNNDDPTIRSEANGLHGRASKQLFVKELPEDKAQAHEEVQEALDHYEKCFASDPAWHGPNMVALCWRAKQEGLTVSQSLPKIIELVRDELQKIDEAHKTNPWSEAAKAQCYLGEDDRENANKVYENYLALIGDCNRSTAAFTLGGDIRQLMEIWSLSSKDELVRGITNKLLTVTHPNLLQQEAGAIWDRLQGAKFEPATVLQAMVSRGIMIHANSVARLVDSHSGIVKISNSQDANMGGTGFLISGDELGYKTGEPLLITNEHVLSENGDNAKFATARANARVEFESLGQTEIQVAEIVWAGSLSRKGDEDEPHDITISRLADIPNEATCLSVCRKPNFAQVNAGEKSLGFVLPVGHPDLSNLVYSFGENDVVDHELDRGGASPARIRYVANTRHGSSGCPIFTGSGEVVAVHEGYCEAREVNQGLALGNIVRAVATDLRTS